jgi:pyruvate dehydrogenase E2 component (dihydrolipoamide acetyltransferase)
MPHDITIPRLGWSMEEGVLGNWLKSQGDFVRAGDPLFTLEGEKAAQEIESLDTGYLCVPPDAPRTGETVKVGQLIGYLLAEGEPAPTTVQIAPPPETSPSTVSAPPGVAGTLPRAAGPAARRLARQLGIDLSTVPTPDPTGRVICEDVQRAAVRPASAPSRARRPIATPRARRRAKDLGVDWTSLTGTGRDGRIRERDVANRRPTPSPSVPPATTPASPGTHTPASKRRLVIAQRMVAGVTQAAPVTIATKADAAPLMAFRDHLKQSTRNGETPSYNDILIHLAARTLREQPQLNACWHRDGIYHYDDVHIALAVDTELGLLAPVVRHADQLSLDQIADQTRQLIADARADRLTQQHLGGGTFTVTNLGVFGIETFTPILNLPQAGILGVGRIVEEPVVRAGRVVVGHTLTLSLTFDHRVVDGAPAARWLQALNQNVAGLDQKHSNAS